MASAGIAYYGRACCCAGIYNVKPGTNVDFKTKVEDMQKDDRINEAGAAADSDMKPIVTTSASIEASPVLAEVPVRIQRSRQHKQVSPNGLPIAYVGRGTRWGNPFRLVKYSDGKWAVKTDGSDRCNELLIKHCHAVYDTRDAAAIDAINCYNFWLLPYTHKEGSMMEFYQSMAQIDDAIISLKGKNLSCWCRLDEKCHADLLLELANR